jgi:hypothetical protein
MRTIEISHLERIKVLTEKIETGNADLLEYQEYETLLIEGGFTTDTIREKMRRNGYQEYKDYLDARKNAKSYEEKRIVNSIIAASLVAFGLAILIWVAMGIIKRKD